MLIIDIIFIIFYAANVYILNWTISSDAFMHYMCVLVYNDGLYSYRKICILFSVHWNKIQFNKNIIDYFVKLHWLSGK